MYNDLINYLISFSLENKTLTKGIYGIYGISTIVISEHSMKLIAVTASGFYGFEQCTRFDFVDNRIICVGANGTGKSNILNLVEFFLMHGTGLNVKLHWRQGRAAWEVHKQCAASLHFSLTAPEQEAFAKWRLVSILGLMATEPTVKAIVADLQRQDLDELSQEFTVLEITPEDADDATELEKSPLFRKLRCERTPSRRVKAFWEVLEGNLLSVYARKRPYNTAVYCAHTEPRDTTSVVFQQVLCDSRDREQLVLQTESAAVSSDARVLIPATLTLEDEVRALRSALCPGSDEGSTRTLRHRGLTLNTISTADMWAAIEEHLRHGIPRLTAPITNIGGGSESAAAELNLANCAFVTPPGLRLYPRVESLVDVRTFISRLILETEKYMTSRQVGCQMNNIGGITYVLRRVLLKSVCILPQDRTLVGDGTYMCLTTNGVESLVTQLMESTSRDDIRAVARMQTAMRTMTGQEIRSHRYLDSGACVVGMWAMLGVRRRYSLGCVTWAADIRNYLWSLRLFMASVPTRSCWTRLGFLCIHRSRRPSRCGYRSVCTRTHTRSLPSVPYRSYSLRTQPNL